MFWDFKKNKIDSDYNLLISLRSKKPYFALFKESGSKNKISYVLNSLENQTSDDLYKNLDLGLQKIVSDGLVSLSENKKPAKIKEVIVCFSAELYESYIKDLVIEKELDFILTKDQFEKAIEKHADVIKAENDGKLILEKDVTNVAINGYSIQNPFGKKVKKLDVSFYASFVDKNLMEEIENIVSKNIHVSKITFKTYTLNLFNVIRRSFLNANNYVSIDIADNHTNIFVVENKALKYRKCLNIGYKDFVNKISEKCNLQPSIVVSEIKMSTSGDINQPCNLEVEKELQVQKNNWVNLIVSEIIDKDGINIPSRVFLTANKNISNIFVKTLAETENKDKIFRNEKETTIINCENKHFNKYIEYKDDVESDIFNTINSINLND
jgi:hypothetical protein